MSLYVLLAAPPAGSFRERPFVSAIYVRMGYLPTPGVPGSLGPILYLLEPGSIADFQNPHKI